jgi:hypothetical protein
VQGTGVVVSWETSGATGTISLLMTDGEISTGNIIPYVNSSDNTVNSLVSSIVEYPALKYRSGQVQYIQNMRPIVRSETQEEEIKLIIEI